MAKPTADPATNPMQAYAGYLRSESTIAKQINKINTTNTNPMTPNTHKVIGGRPM